MASKKLEAVFSESQVIMLLEEFSGNLKLVHEGISAIDKKIDNVEERLTEKIAHVDFKVNVLNKKIDSVEEHLSVKIAEVKADVAVLKIDTDEVKPDLAAHRNNTELHQTPKKRPLKRV